MLWQSTVWPPTELFGARNFKRTQTPPRARLCRRPPPPPNPHRRPLLPPLFLLICNLPQARWLGGEGGLSTRHLYLCMIDMILPQLWILGRANYPPRLTMPLRQLASFWNCAAVLWERLKKKLIGERICVYMYIYLGLAPCACLSSPLAPKSTAAAHHIQILWLLPQVGTLLLILREADWEQASASAAPHSSLPQPPVAICGYRINLPSFLGQWNEFCLIICRHDWASPTASLPQPPDEGRWNGHGIGEKTKWHVLPFWPVHCLHRWKIFCLFS